MEATSFPGARDAEHALVRCGAHAQDEDGEGGVCGRCVGRAPSRLHPTPVDAHRAHSPRLAGTRSPCSNALPRSRAHADSHCPAPTLSAGGVACSVATTTPHARSVSNTRSLASSLVGHALTR
eukprot:4192892-Prymnesium_polylepis.1